MCGCPTNSSHSFLPFLFIFTPLLFLLSLLSPNSLSPPGDLVPQTAAAKWLCIVWGTFGIAVFALESTLLRWLLVDFALRPWLRFEAKRMKQWSTYLDSKFNTKQFFKTKGQKVRSKWFAKHSCKTETLVMLMLALIFFVAIGTFAIGFIILCKISYHGMDEAVQVAYLVITMATTVGYGDITPQMPPDRIAFALFAPFICSVTAALVFSAANVMVDYTVEKMQVVRHRSAVLTLERIRKAEARHAAKEAQQARRQARHEARALQLSLLPPTPRCSAKGARAAEANTECIALEVNGVEAAEGEANEDTRSSASAPKEVEMVDVERGSGGAFVEVVSN